jgi:hypothetical protein
MKLGIRIALFGAITAVGTAAAGWWLILVGVVALQGPVPAVAAMCSAVLGLPRWGFPLVTLLFPATLAGTAAVLTKPSSSA